ncbi:hypothetical protein BC829DRAFT_360887 [Chytridium lagenaria]|nr:hypothetical protein BC829DRAFT_360887 [Chytridium lagenaria]
MSSVDSIGNWTPRKTFGTSPSSICLASCAAVSSKSIFTFGGFHLYSASVNNSLYVLNADTMVWSKVEQTRGEPPCARYGHSMTLWGSNKLVIFGGCDSSDADLNDVYILHLSDMTWEKLQTTGPPSTGRHNHAATIHEGKLYIHGGQTNFVANFLGDLNVLDLDTLRWSGPMTIGTRYGHFTFVYQNCFYIYGGSLNDDKMQNTDEIIAVDLDDFEASTLTIESRSSPPKLGRRFAQICGNRLVVVNSSFSPRLENMKSQGRSFPTGVWSLSLQTFKWKRHDKGLSCLDQGSWHYYAMAPGDNKLMLLGVATLVTESLEGYEEHVDDYMGWMLKMNIDSFGILSVPKSTMQADFESLYAKTNLESSSKGTTDFSIFSKDDPIPIGVHTLILNSRWPHFGAVLRSGMTEALGSSLTLPEPRETLLGFVKYLYTDTLSTLPDEIIADLLVMGNVYCLERLQKLACSILHERLNVENVSRVFLRASRAGEIGLKERAIALALERFGEVARTPAFRGLSKPELDELLDCIPIQAGMTVSKETSPRKRPIAMVDNDGEPELDVEENAEAEGDVDADADMEADTDVDLNVDDDDD